MKLVVLGAAESGVGAAILAGRKGYDVFVSDMGTILPHYKAMLDAEGLAWEEGKHSEEQILDADEIVKSPGIPDDAPLVSKLRTKGTPILSDIEFAARYTSSRMLCITGSNGKTTVTSLIYYILKTAGFNVALAGNIGRSFALQVAEAEQNGMPDWFVLELSSFQLDNMYDFRADIAVLLNITPDHLDRYGFVMQNYVDSKMRILRNQRADDVFIYWKEDEYISRELERLSPLSQLCPFTDAPTAGACAYGEGEAGADSYGFAAGAMLSVKTPREFSMPLSELSLPGRHNLRNCLAAAMATLSAGVDASVLRQCLSDFPGVEHRLEKVGTHCGVHYINDSKATNVDACFVALEAQTTPVVLIIGGKDKGNDYSVLHDLIRRKCRALVYLGADNSKLHEAFDRLTAKSGIFTADTHSMADCVAACKHLAQPGDTVLLSPCCASFDLFKNMEDRGEQFKHLVHLLSDCF
ncbi:UDP-N-acetylmuramoyl-L-alanine--D-glutamate ligase [Alloprevotella sp. OH1205_COT-284]|uniref:UDP-N-acetylmuramoyl-L-alanine--D-glutamate ligase n=1 Tax=Alloprevotella sp. OH1205_COT-284 TaxID=2491043 RepID=UPI000F5EFA9B|nr:UDP-N-acetylmuramoyl-L-alanine--D-glutamate ligase [Alloprevotella sp. OH1205_COT-284]RRD77741.1 UDP-N-acetylmuramoyl-L-alanine--D-glutamate ligase [Alloprevotella sp. OH1205_COT-284]